MFQDGLVVQAAGGRQACGPVGGSACWPTCWPATAMVVARCRNSGSAISSASSTQASTCSGVGSSGSSAGSCRIRRAMPAPGACGSTPAKTPSTKSSIICCRSWADSRASLCMSSVSSIVVPRVATVLSTARRSRSSRICSSSTATCAFATCATVVARDRTARITSRPRPSSRSVRTRSRRATASASYRRYPPADRPAGGTSPASDQNRIVREVRPVRAASCPMLNSSASVLMPRLCTFQPLEAQAEYRSGQLRERKKSRTSAPSRSGASRAAKWPPG